MKGDLPRFELLCPKDLEGALSVLDQAPGEYRALAGGTDVMVLFAAGKLSHTRWINLWNLPELRECSEAGDAIVLGALTTYTDVQRSATLRSEFPMLCQAASETGGIAIQNRGTLGGNVVNASPAADSPPALLAYGASIELVSARGSRWVDYASFHTGYKRHVMAPNELVRRIRLPRIASPEGRVHFYRKVGPRKAQAISKVCFAASADLQGARVSAVKIAIGGVAPIIPRCVATERVLVSEGIGREALESAKAALASEIAPIDDVRSSARYRSKVAENLLVDFVISLRHRVGLAP